MTWLSHFSNALQTQQQQQAYRQRPLREAHSMLPYCVLHGQRHLNFAANDYLGLSHDVSIIKAWQKALTAYGVGSGGSALLGGHTDAHAQLEHFLANWLGYERAILFPSGFAANQAVLLGLLDADAVLLADKFCHASMQEAAQLSPARFRRFAHQRLDILANYLAQYQGKRILVASEGVFSMDGDQADLQGLTQLCQQYGAWLVLDDAHGIGVLGTEGKGSVASAKVLPEILVVTFGKAVGSMGAAVLCNQITAEYLTQFARHLIYSTALPPAQAAGLYAAFQRIRAADDLRAQLQDNIQLFRQTLAQQGLEDALLPSQTAIQPFICGSNEAALHLSQQLKQRGFYVPAIRPPTVPQGKARLRITLSAAHQPHHIMQLCEALHELTR